MAKSKFGGIIVPLEKVEVGELEGIEFTEEVRRIIRRSNDTSLLGLLGSEPQVALKRLVDEYVAVK